MGKKATESIGINLLKALLSKTTLIDSSNILENDKTVSWDGFFLLYNNPSFKKDGLLGKVSTQVKTIHSESKTKNFTISRNDLENYKKEGHIFYFYIKLNKSDNPTFYYLPLLLWDINNYLKRMGNKKSKSFEFQLLPTNPSEILIIVRNFVIEMNKQKQLMPGVDSVSDLIAVKGNGVSLSFDLRIKGKPTLLNIIKEMKKQPYLRYHCDDVNIDFVVDRLPPNIRLEIISNNTLGVGENVYYRNITYVCDGDTTIIKGSDFIIITIKNNSSLRIQYKIFGDYKDRITTLKFVEDMCLNNKLSIGKIDIEISSKTSKEICENSANLRDLYNELSAIKEYLHVNVDPCFDNASEEDVKVTHALYRTLILKEKYNSNGRNSHFIKVDLLGMRLYLYEFVDEKGMCSLLNWDKFELFFNDELNNQISASPYYIFSICDNNLFLKFDNYDLNLFTSELFNAPKEILESGSIEFVVINMISAYDSINNESFLNAALSVSRKTLELYPFNLSALINIAQILVRKKIDIDNQIEEEFRKDLMLFASNHSVCFGIYVVLGEKENAAKELELCEKSEIEKIKQWPIYYLYKQLK